MSVARAIAHAIAIVKRNDPPEFVAIVHPGTYDDA